MGLSKKTKKKRGYSRRLGLRRRGAGNRGGRGRAGWGKRAKQKKTKYSLEPRKKGFTSFSKKFEHINLSDLEDKKEYKKHKVLGRGEVKKGITVKASYFTKKAKEKIEKAGGKWIELQ